MRAAKFAVFSAIAVSMALGMASTSIRADTVFSNFELNYGIGRSAGWCVTGNTNKDCGPQTDRWVASPFTPNGTFTLTQVDLALGNSSGTNSALVELVNSVSGVPGTSVLESWSVAGLPSSFSSSTPLLTLTSTGGVTLDSGTQYWLVAKASAADTLDFWYGNVDGLSVSYESLNDGAIWFALSNIPGTMTAFDVLGTPVTPTATPEPVSLLLFGTGLLGLGWMLRRRRVVRG